MNGPRPFPCPPEDECLGCRYWRTAPVLCPVCWGGVPKKGGLKTPNPCRCDALARAR